MDNSKFAGYIIATLIVGGFVVIGTILMGWALSTLWGWFIVPVFRLPPLSITQAVGLALTVSLFKSSSYQSNKEQSVTDDIIKLFVNAIINPVFFVVLGWVILRLM